MLTYLILQSYHICNAINRQGGTTPRGRILLSWGRPVRRAPPVPIVQQGAFRRNLRAFWPTAPSMSSPVCAKSCPDKRSKTGSGHICDMYVYLYV